MLLITATNKINLHNSKIVGTNIWTVGAHLNTRSVEHMGMSIRIRVCRRVMMVFHDSVLRRMVIYCF
jgi:hypothetical protein